ncbi:MAG: hypothetical protein ACW96U_09200 [Candidatus Heimdallarchaeaceae archaeon]
MVVKTETNKMFEKKIEYSDLLNDTRVIEKKYNQVSLKKFAQNLRVYLNRSSISLEEKAFVRHNLENKIKTERNKARVDKIYQTGTL